MSTSTNNRLKSVTAILRTVPNIVVFLMLAAIIYAGHHTGWKMPKFSELMGAGVADSNDWCIDHLVPESQCIECKSDLLPKEQTFGFCKPHGVAECVTHHPELAQVNGKPMLPKYDTVQAVATIERPENNSRDTLHTKRVQFTTAESVLKSGIEVDIVGEGSVTEAITANGELIFDPNRVALLSSKISGTIVSVQKTIGDTVVTGDILALVDASQVGVLKAELLKNIVQLQLQKDNVGRLAPLAETGAVSVRNLIEAKTALQEAEVALLSSRQQLANLGFDLPENFDSENAEQIAKQLRYVGIPASTVDSLPATSKSGNLIPILAPFDGVVVSSDAVLGKAVDPSKPILTVSDPGKMWVMLNVRQEDARYIQLGQMVQFRSDNGDQEVTGKISWISPSLDERTRTLKIRLVVENPDGRLRDKTFGTGKIILREEQNAVLVPQEAVQATTDAQFVFVRDKNYFDENSLKIFHVRQVRLGTKNGHNVEILAGVLPGEVIVTKGSNVLLAHLLRSNLGAGCCAED